MDSKLIYQNVLHAISKKIPADQNMVNVIDNMLQLGKDKVYRRINGEVPFSFLELAIISKKLDISLDHIVSSEYVKKQPSEFIFDGSVNPASHYYILLEEIVNLLKSANGKDGTEGGEATNNIPQPLYFMYENISRYFLFKWKCQFENSEKISYEKVTIPKKLRKLQLDNIKAFQYLSNTDYIFDNLLFRHLVSEIKSFKLNNLISYKDCQLIKSDLFKILNDINELSKTGCFKESGNTLNIYISNTEIHTSYCYIRTPDQKVSLVKAFSLNGITAVDEETFNKVKVWTDSLKRQSTLISVTGEKERVEFIDEQYKIIETI